MFRRGTTRAILIAAALCSLGRSLPGQEGSAIRSYHDALRLARDGKYDAAIEVLRRANREDPSFPRPYQKIAQICQQTQQPDKAREYFQSLVREAPNAAPAQYALALSHIQQRQLADAEAALRRALELAPEFTPAYTRLVLLAIQQGRAAALAEELQTMADANAGSAAVRYALGFLSIQQGKWEPALENIRKAKSIAPGVWEVLDAEFTVHYRTNRLPEALAVLETMLRKAEESGHLEWKTHITGRMGAVHYDMANYAAATARLRESIALADELGDVISEQTWRGQLANAYVQMGRYREALGESRAALELARRHADRVNEGRNLGTIASIYAEMADYQKAIESYQLAIKVAREGGDRSNEADQLASLALVYTDVGYHDRALTNLKSATALAQAMKNPWLEGRFLEATGDVYRNLERYQEALAAYNSGLAVAKRIGDRLGEASRLASSADVRVRTGRASDALADFTQALQISREAGAAVVEGRILNDLGDLHLRAGRRSDALQCHKEALAVGSASQMPEVTWRAHAGIAAVLERQGQEEIARESYERAVDTIERVRGNLRIAEEKAGFLEDKLDVYSRLIALLVRLRDTDGAFRYAERARARSALDLIAEAEKRIDGGIDAPLAVRQRELHRRFSRLQSELMQPYSDAARNRQKSSALAAALEAADEEHRSLRREIHDRHPRYADFRYPQPIGLTETRRLLTEKQVLLEYVVGREQSFLFAVTREDQFVARLPGAASLAPRVRKLREAIATPPNRTALSTYWLTAQSLYRDLIAPADRLLRGRGELIIAADGILHYMPFAALLRPMQEVPAEINPTHLPYLVREHAISYVPSASVLATVRRYREGMPKAKRMLLALGDPDYAGAAGGAGPDRSLRRLVHSRAEIEGIARLYPGRMAQVFLGDRASETNVKAQPLDGYRFVHFAAHGLLNERNPQFSGLFLSRPPRGVEDEDGVLQSYEIFNLRLNADLVVLSACETGLGKAVRGEGLVGLTQAFLYAGTSAVAVSLWNVADRSTADLMIPFYRALREARVSKASALRRAQLHLIDTFEFAHPYYWAPFALIGDSR
jgi:CHAT domain-containing protein/Tfp pilus assembly protein PilF